MDLSGEVVELQTANYKATLVSTGAGIASLQFKGRDIVMPHAVDQVAISHMGKSLIPWPNRITDGRYTWNEVEYQLWINEFVTPSAIHGLCAYEHWDVLEQNSHSVTFAHIIAARLGYPFTLECKVKYELEDAKTATDFGGLKVTMLVTNLSKNAAPVVIGSHPYLTCNGELNDHYELKLCSKLLLQKFDQKFNLQGEESVAWLDSCLNTDGQRIGEHKLDNCFRLDAPQGQEWCCEISSGNLVAGMKSNTPYLQLFTAEKLERKCFAIEPMTDNVNAFNISEQNTLALQPNQTRQMVFSIYGRER